MKTFSLNQFSRLNFTLLPLLPASQCSGARNGHCGQSVTVPLCLSFVLTSLPCSSMGPSQGIQSFMNCYTMGCSVDICSAMGHLLLPLLLRLSVHDAVLRFPPHPQPECFCAFLDIPTANIHHSHVPAFALLHYSSPIYASILCIMFVKQLTEHLVLVLFYSMTVVN